ncbi:extracellular solute-binding protein [Paenibacillus ginsengihumi]|uniref:extracellular solute-binding protein n=1 Tax=Paenibacillus ginsengihumi TaxID=431596 RepID=UPI0003822E41|nr:extracellular solute-binding protein [Paenibacillus ginsengihumi]
MKLRKRAAKKWAASIVVTALALTSVACQSGGAPAGENNAANGDGGSDKPMDITIMMPVFKTEYPKDDSPVLAEIEKLTNTNLHIEWVPNSSYGDKVNITLASAKLPTLMVIEKSSSFVNAARAGAFWDLTPYLKDYPNLSQANEIVLNNTSVDGKIYGIYRKRDLGRNGIVYRKDWLDNVGLQPPKTIDEFYNMLKAFKEKDPDQNGKDDTYGMVVTKWTGGWGGPFDIIQTWFGAPNKWGEDENGKLQPAFMTKEYKDTLVFFKKLYDEKLINQDFAVFDTAKYSDPLINGQAGVMVDVLDNAARVDEKIHDMQQKAGKTTDPNVSFTDVIGSVEGPKGLRTLPTSGYNMMIAVSKTAVKNEDELRKVLAFLDKMNDPELQILAQNGIEGKHYTKTENGIQPSKDIAMLDSELTGLNQMLMFIPEDRTLKPIQTPIRKKQAETIKENEKIVVANPAEPLISEVYAQKGPQLDNIINDARVKYIVGQIDDAGWEAAIELWKKSGGDDYVKEINELYAKLPK